MSDSVSLFSKLLSPCDVLQRFLLKDCDFEERGGGTSLPFLLKRNPHSSHWGDMKLYLLCQVGGRVGGEGWGRDRIHVHDSTKLWTIVHGFDRNGKKIDIGVE